ncbi:MAG: O-antigen ligase family protein [Candidatus Woesebacteria bacterium]|nr:O-antigen ligase family protein [Candidatus Woesebacteria bacterium]
MEYFVPFFAILAFFPYQKGKNLEFYIKVLMIVVFVVFLYGMGQKYLNFPVIMTQNSESSKGAALSWVPGSQLSSTFAGHYDLALFMVLVLPILISLIFVVKNRVSKIVLILSSLCGYWLLINTASRISLASYLIAVCISLFLMKKTKAIILVVVISLILSVFSPSLFARYKSLIDVYSQKIKNVKIVNTSLININVSAQEIVPTITTPKPVIEDRSTSIRLNVEWPRAIRAFSKNPLLGTGYSSIGLASDNDYLRLLAEVGILGFLGFILILTRIIMVFVSAYPLHRKLSGVRLGFVAGVVGGFLGTLINAVFIDVFEASKFAIIFWLLVGLAVYVVKDISNEHKV